MDIENLYRTGAIYDFIKNPPPPPQKKSSVIGSVRGGGGANRQHVGFNFKHPSQDLVFREPLEGIMGR